jgi:hypothetical protein
MPGLKTRLLPILVGVLALCGSQPRAADRLPDRIDDNAFWRLVEDLSEPGGVFQSENLLSNETGFQAVIPRLQESAKAGGVYLGVGPEQNFTYIAAVRPKIAFIIDIRRQNMLEHLIYKALFEMCDNRVDFVSRLFSRKRPSGLTRTSTVDEIFHAFATAPSDDDGFRKTLEEINDRLTKKHGFGLTAEDTMDVEHIFTAFRVFGPDLNYNSGLRRGGGMPTYGDLMTATDRRGEQRSYLASDENYQVVRDLEQHNLIVALTGDFGGSKALRAVGQYVKDHDATVTAFYLSNVERYLFQRTFNQNGGWTNFFENVSTFPLDKSSTFIRSVSGVPGGLGGMRLPNVLASIQETLAAVQDGRIRTYSDVFEISR